MFSFKYFPFPEGTEMSREHPSICNTQVLFHTASTLYWTLWVLLSSNGSDSIFPVNFAWACLLIRNSLPRYVCVLVWIRNWTLWVKWVEQQLSYCYQNQPTTLSLISSLEIPINRRSGHFVPHLTCWAFILLSELFVLFHDICLLIPHNMQRSKGNSSGNNTQII